MLSVAFSIVMLSAGMLIVPFCIVMLSVVSPSVSEAREDPIKEFWCKNLRTLFSFSCQFQIKLAHFIKKEQIFILTNALA